MTDMKPAITAAQRLISAVIFALTLSIPLTAATAKEDSEAHRLMMRAVEARAIWDEAFPGFTADIAINYEGEIHRGQVRVTPQGEVELIDADESRSEALAWAQSWLGMLVFHRMGQGEEDHYRGIRMVGDPNHPLGVLLALNDEFNSSFRVAGKIIRQVNRDLSAGETAEGTALERVRINVLEARATPEGKILPLHFVINYLDDQRQLAMVDTLSSGFTRLQGYDLPRWCRVITTADGEMTAGVLKLSDHRLSL
jgi:hypothetical protein